jgi:hypothetical protein
MLLDGAAQTEKMATQLHGMGDFQNRFIVSLYRVSVVSLKLKKSAMGYEWTKKLKWCNGSV